MIETEEKVRNENGIIENEKPTVQQKIWRITGAILRAAWPVGLYMILPAIFLSVGYVLTGHGRTIDEFTVQSGNFYTILGIIVVILIFIWRAKKKKVNFFDEITLSFDKKMIPKLLILLGLGASISLAVSSALTVIPLPKFLIQSYEDSSQGMYRGTDVILVMLSQVFLAPFAEEMVFRGFMLNRLLRQFDEKAAVIAVTITFGLCHINGIWVVYAVLMGYLLTKVSIKEDNVLHSMILHAGFNFPSVVIFVINSNENAYNAFFGSKWLIIIYGLVSIGCAILFWRLYNKEKQYVEED